MQDHSIVIMHVPNLINEYCQHIQWRKTKVCVRRKFAHGEGRGRFLKRCQHTFFTVENKVLIRNSVMFKLALYCSVLMAYCAHIIWLNHFTIGICSFYSGRCFTVILMSFYVCCWSYTGVWYFMNVFVVTNLTVSESDILKLVNQSTKPSTEIAL